MKRDFKFFERKPWVHTSPCDKALPVLTLEGARSTGYMFDSHLTAEQYRQRMESVRHWHQLQIDNTNPKDSIYGRNVPRYKQVVKAIDIQLAGL